MGLMQVDLVFMDYVPNMSAELEMVRKSLYLEKLIRALLGHGGNPAVVAIEVRPDLGAAATAAVGSGIDSLLGKQPRFPLYGAPLNKGWASTEGHAARMERYGTHGTVRHARAREF